MPRYVFFFGTCCCLFFGLVTLGHAEPPPWIDSVRANLRPGDVLDAERVTLGDVAHDRVVLRAGEGPHDRIAVHRVARASGDPGPPVFLLHGGRWGFAPIFLDAGSATPTPTSSLALFLADAGFDVWGLDARWILASADVPPTSYLDWTLATDLADLDLAVELAERVRRGRPGGWALVGYSRGGQWALAAANADATVVPAPKRRFDRLVVIDSLFVTDDPMLRQAACQRLDALRARLAAGISFDDGRFFNQIGQLALDAPDDPSPLAPGLTNGQLVLLFGVDADPGRAIVPEFHRIAGDITFPPLRVTPRHTDPVRWFDLWARGSEVLPLGPEVAFEATLCDRPNESTPWDDALDQVSIPVLYIGAGGGIGEFGFDVLSRLGSTDITVVSIDDEPDPAARGVDRGHLDLVLSSDAAAATWTPIRDWIVDRSER